MPVILLSKITQINTDGWSSQKRIFTAIVYPAYIFEQAKVFKFNFFPAAIITGSSRSNAAIDAHNLGKIDQLPIVHGLMKVNLHTTGVNTFQVFAEESPHLGYAWGGSYPVLFTATEQG